MATRRKDDCLAGAACAASARGLARKELFSRRPVFDSAQGMARKELFARQPVFESMRGPGVPSRGGIGIPTPTNQGLAQARRTERVRPVGLGSGSRRIVRLVHFFCCGNHRGCLWRPSGRHLQSSQHDTVARGHVAGCACGARVSQRPWRAVGGSEGAWAIRVQSPLEGSPEAAPEAACKLLLQASVAALAFHRG